MTPITCSFGGLNTYNWIGINTLVILLFLIVAALIFALSNLLPRRNAEKLKSYAKFEMTQSMVSFLIIAMLIIFSSVTCNVSLAITGSDPFTFAQAYIENLLFVDGVNIITQIFTVTIQYTIEATISQNIINFVGLTSVGISQVFDAYSGAIAGLPSGLVIGTFGMLLLQWLLLPIVKAISLTILVPLAIVIRSFSFFGPKLREAADSFLAIGIALYFIFPLTFVLDSMITGWVYGTCATCNPYPSFIAPYALNKIPASSLFSSQTTSGTLLSTPVSISGSVYGTMFSDGLSPSQLIYLPNTISTIASNVAEYLFEGVVLIALNMALVVVFAVGLSRGLTQGLDFLRGGGFW